MVLLLCWVVVRYTRRRERDTSVTHDPLLHGLGGAGWVCRGTGRTSAMLAAFAFHGGEHKAAEHKGDGAAEAGNDDEDDEDDEDLCEMCWAEPPQVQLPPRVRSLHESFLWV